MKGNQENRHIENSLLRNVCCGLENKKIVKKICSTSGKYLS